MPSLLQQLRSYSRTALVVTRSHSSVKPWHQKDPTVSFDREEPNRAFESGPPSAAAQRER